MAAFKTNDWKEKDRLVSEGKIIKGYRVTGHIPHVVEEWEFNFEKPDDVATVIVEKPLDEKKPGINWGAIGGTKK